MYSLVLIRDWVRRYDSDLFLLINNLFIMNIIIWDDLLFLFIIRLVLVLLITTYILLIGYDLLIGYYLLVECDLLIKHNLLIKYSLLIE